MVKFNDERKNIILKARENGLNICDCAILANVDESTLHRWLKKGKTAKSGKYRQFYLDFKYSEVKNKLYHLKKIQDDKSWQSSAWYVERKYPEEYGRKDSFNVQADVKTQQEINLSEKFDDDKIRSILNGKEDEDLDG